jgi:glycosyltransferase involved in cell wall biosynthesis
VGAALEPSGRPFELIVVDDGSKDGSAALLATLAEGRAWLRPVFLARNYGQSAALQAGFDAARGAVIVTLDGDLQNDPADIPGLLKTLEERPEIGMISGWRKDRKDAFFLRKIPSWIANAVISRMTGVRLHDYGCALKAYRTSVIREIRLYGELHRFIPALAADVGAAILEVPVNHHARMRGKSKYGISRTFRVLLDLMWVMFLMRFLHRPMHVFGGTGMLMFLAGVGVLGYLTYQKLVLGLSIAGRPLLLLGSLLALIGVQLAAAGVLGELLTRIYHEPAGRAHYVLKPSPRPGGKDRAGGAGSSS